MYVQLGDVSAPSVAAKAADVVRICLIDPSGILKSSSQLREQFRSRLEDKFNKLDPAWLKQHGFVFRVIYLASEPTDAQKARLGPLDFPVYLLGKQHGTKTVLELLGKHSIPENAGKQNLHELATDCWGSRDTRGCGIPPLRGFRKIGFVKVRKVMDEAPGDIWLALVNTTAHEIGHMGNRTRHSEKGLMKYPVPQDRAIDFDTDDRRLFLSDLLRLRAIRESRKPRVHEFRHVFR